MKYKSILIVTYGRSGSILLQGIVNQIPDCTVRGENNNFIYPLFNSYKRLKEAKIMERKSSEKFNTAQHSWYGASQLDEEVFIEAQKNMIKTLLIGNSKAKYYGFKEIRYFNVLNSLDEFLSFLELVMDDVAIIFNIRNSHDVANSSWWKDQNKKELVQKLDKATQKYIELSKRKENAFCFNYDRLMTDITIVEELHNFLDVKFDKNRIEQLLKIEHSQDNKKVIGNV